jgi:uncharacterized membrane protein YeaQ/YmgE (transglycosylase-associated protein family)
MYGYEPPDQDQHGSWREVLLVLRVVFSAILPILGSLIGAALLLALTVFLLIRYPPLALIPLAVIGAVIYLLIRRDRRRHEEERRRIFGDR